METHGQFYRVYMILNVVLVMEGFCVAGFGTFILTQGDMYKGFVGTEDLVVIVVLGFGCMIFGVLGMVAEKVAEHGHPHVLWVYIAVLVIAVIVEFGFGVVIVVRFGLGRVLAVCYHASVDQ